MNNKCMHNFKKAKDNIVFIYSVIFLIAAFLTFFYFLIMGKTFIFKVDANMQQYPLLVELRRIVGRFLRGDGFAFWVDHIGLGSDTIGNLGIIIMDPFNYIAAAFPVKYIDIGYTIAVLLRMYAAGLSMMAFLRYHSFSRKNVIFGSISYAFCFWSVGVIRHAFFLLPLILFPLVILGIDMVFDKRKPYVLIAAVVGSLVTYIYFAYMTAIIAFIYIVVRYLVDDRSEKKSIKDFFYQMLLFIVPVLIAACISAPVIVSVTYALINAGKSTGIDILFFLNLKQLLRFIPGLICNMEVSGHYSYFGINALTALLIPIMWLRIKRKNFSPQLLMFCFCLFVSLFPLWGSFMNGFSYPMGRWCYTLAFFFVWTSVSVLEEDWEIIKNNMKMLLGWSFILLGLIMFNVIFINAFARGIAMTGFAQVIFMFLFWAMIYFGNTKYLYHLLIADIGIFYLLSFSPFVNNNIESFLDAGVPYSMYESSLLRAAAKIKDRGFWRVDYTEHLTQDDGIQPYLMTPFNENLYWGIRTPSYYLSSLNANFLEFNKELENNGGYIRRMCVFSNDRRSRLDYLQGIRYFLRLQDSEVPNNYAGYEYRKERPIDSVLVSKSRHKTSLGYVFPYVIDQEQFDKYSPLDKEQVLMQACVLSKEDIDNTKLDTISPSDIQIDTREIAYNVKHVEDNNLVNNGSFQVKQDEDRTMILSLPRITKSEVYILLKGLKKTPSSYKEMEDQIVELNGNPNYQRYRLRMDNLDYHPYGDFECFVEKDQLLSRIYYADGDPQGLTDREDFMVNLGYYNVISGDVMLHFGTPGHYTYDDIIVYAVPQKHFKEQAAQLSKNRFSLKKQTNNELIGTVNTDRAGLLYLSLLYHPGWKIYVDGKEENILKTDLCFMGVKLGAGKHEVRLVYRPVGFKISLLLSLAGICAVVFIICKGYRKKI